MQEDFLTLGKISENIRAALLAKGINQNQLADAASVSNVTISRYMSGNRTPGTEELYRMARVLDVSMEYLLTGQQNRDTEWKTRALSAEKKLSEMKALVGKLGDITKDLTAIVSE